ncbi:MAG: hypothetical protein ACD_75C01076G0002 [uncultured bacterium]|nr:MAG: hypothetical protein ACD_75C01076G0002 [uncultured bacterium]
MHRMNARSETKSQVPDFRKVASGYAKDFMLAKDRVSDLLGREQNAESGRYREELLRGFLRTLLPTAVAVDTGFIYGFEKVPTSKQLDIIIWHRAAHCPVYDAGQFVIVPPESVIAVVSVKSNMTRKELRGGLDNLLSVAPLDCKLRKKPMPSISKFLVFYTRPDPIEWILPAIQTFYAKTLQEQHDLMDALVPPLKQYDPSPPLTQSPLEVFQEVWRIYPRLITTIDEGSDANYAQWMGPSDGTLGSMTYGPAGLKGLPFMYRHDKRITTAFEKFIFYLLEAVFTTLESPALSLLSAWGDFNPATGCRSGDAREIMEMEGVPLMDYEN